MDRAKSESPEGIGAVKAAISQYGERTNSGNLEKKQPQNCFQEDPPSDTRVLQLAKMGIKRFREVRHSAEKENAHVESALHIARTTAKELARQIEDMNAKASAKKLELQLMRRPERGKEERKWETGVASDPYYTHTIGELDNLKQQLGRLKLDVASALEEKAKAEMEAEASNSKTKSYLCAMEELTKQLEEANEEHVLVEIARIEAEREFREITARREAEGAHFANDMEATKKKIKKLRIEIDVAEELEGELAATNSDVDVLQNEMELVKAMERSHLKNKSDKRKLEESECQSSLQAAEAELKMAKKELASIEEEGFHFMASMDLTREELTHITQEATRLKNLGKKADSTIQCLNSKLLKARSKCEFASQANERAEAIVSNLSAALQKLQTEMEKSKKEKELISAETKCIKMEVEKTDRDFNAAEERLQAAMQELAAVKTAEALALRELRGVAEKTMEARASSLPRSSTITISKSEYDYLRQRAAAAQVVADKKVDAAQAWIEALKAREKEIVMKSECVERDTKQFRALEEEQLREMESSLVARKTIQEELYNWRQNEEEEEMAVSKLVPTPRRSMRGNGVPAPASRRVKIRRPSADISNGTGLARSPLFTIRKRRKVMPNLVKLLRKQQKGKQN